MCEVGRVFPRHVQRMCLTGESPPGRPRVTRTLHLYNYRLRFRLICLVSAGGVVLSSDPDSRNEDSKGDSNSEPELSGNVDDPNKDCFRKLLNEISKKYRLEGIEDLLLLCSAFIPRYSLREKEYG